MSDPIRYPPPWSKQFSLCDLFGAMTVAATLAMAARWLGWEAALFAPLIAGLAVLFLTFTWQRFDYPQSGYALVAIGLVWPVVIGILAVMIAHSS
jgi:hypothetical protein